MTKQILIYSLEGCPYSQKAENLLIDNEILHNLKKVNQGEKNDVKKHRR